MNIVQTPNEILNKKAEPVSKVDAKLKAIIKEMKQTLRESDIGVGLAAPQVGISLQLFVASVHMPDIKNKNREPVFVCINPKIVSKSNPSKTLKKEKKQKLEGCLSIISIWGPVVRANKVTIQYLGENGKKHTKSFSGFMATIVQHEIDHLNGVLFTQRVLEQGNSLYREIPQSDEFEEIEI